MLLIIYNPEIYKEYLLPEEAEADFGILLDYNTFGLYQNVELNLFGTIDGWLIKRGASYSIQLNGQLLKEHILQDGDILDIGTACGDCFQVIVTDFQFAFPIMKKIDLSNVRDIYIGKNESNQILYSFQKLISGTHCVIQRRSDGFYFQDTSANGSFYKYRRIHGERRLQFGDCIDIFGLHIVYLDSILAVGTSYGQMKLQDGVLQFYVQEDCPDESKSPVDSTHTFFNRSPRNLPEIASDTVEIESPPAPKGTKEKPLLLTIGPSFTMAIPMMLGCGIALLSTILSGNTASAFMFTGIITAISSAALGVFWAMMNLRYSKRESREEEEQRFNAYGNYLIQIAGELKQKYEQNERALHSMYPSVLQCSNYTENSPELWSRNYTHRDFLFQRLGLGNIPFQVNIEVPKEKFSIQKDTLQEKPYLIQDEYRMLNGVPAGIDLREHSLYGLVGGKNKKGAVKLMQLIAAGVAANNSYTDVKLAFVYDREDTKNAYQWECMKWFPHVWSEDKSIRFLAGNETEKGDVFFELANVLRKRSEQTSASGRKEHVKPYYLLFVQDALLLEGELIRKYIFEPKEEYGMIVFLMSETFEQLPNDCENIIQYDTFFQGVYNVLQTDSRIPIQFDEISAQQIEAFGRRISGLRVQELETHADIPSSLDFFQMYDVHSLKELNVEERWRRNRTYNSMKALVGKKLGNADCYLDIHEKYHGPHGLIAGTTGSGKSETLQTYMLSLALNFSPDDLAFFVIDFKGGGMANLFSNLPHMAGQISNLSGNQVRRAMISIKSENMRRQRLFSEYGVNNINLYTRLYKNHEAAVPIPHLLIIIDEFAELKREEPDFMRELISVAQVGRSLGVHLILATQKPSGTVDDSIWSNSKFRLCLRVQDRQDSNDMLHKPDAAFLTQAGRCYLQVGNDELYELFQSGYSGAPYYEDEDSSPEASANLLTSTGKIAVVANRKRRSQRKAETGDAKQKTQLDAIVEYLGEVAEKNGYHYRMKLWMPVLPNKLYLQQLKGYERGLYAGKYVQHKGKWELSALIGLYDDPERQAQNPLVISFSEDGHHAVCGTVVSGKSTFLQTVLYAMIMHYSPEELNIYALDFSSKMLAPFEEAPQTGGILYENDEEKIGKLFYLLRSIMDERKKLFHGGNYSQYVQVHGVTVPAVLIVIDNFAGFKEKTANRYEEDLIRLSREGVGYGMYLFVSSAGFGISEIQNRIGDNIRTVFSLDMGDKFHYMDILRSTHIPLLPESDVKGRGLAWVNGSILEYQAALALEAEDDFTRGERIAEQCRNIRQSWKRSCAKPIPMIPEKPTLKELTGLEEYAVENRQAEKLPFAYDLADASLYSVLLGHIYCYSIFGKKRAGKTNTMKILLCAAARQDADVVIIESEGTELKLSAKEYGVRYLSEPIELFQYFKELTPVFVERNKKKQALIACGKSDEEIFAEMKQYRPVYLFIADFKNFLQTVYTKHEKIMPMNGFLENIIEKGSLHNIYFFTCFNVEDAAAMGGYKLYNLFTDYKTGVYLGGNLSVQRIFTFQNIPYNELTKNQKKGIGYVPEWEDDTLGQKIVIPLAVQ